ncbi:MAG: ATP-binding protein, partial [Candidatus Omnitrophica bacterium]|nr:ATP-binding protein [Candidatus Omnitrophota bacterium]
GKFGLDAYPMGHLFMLCFISILAYAIIKHRLMDINIAVKKALIYSLLIVIITTIYIMLIFLLEKYFSNIMGYRSMPLALLLITIFSVIFIPLKNRIQTFIDNRFFHGSIAEIDAENLLLRDELQKTEKMKAVATLAAGMAHEIKNPLTAIKTFTEYLPEKYNDPEFREKFNKIVGKEVDRINYIVKELLEFSKPSELSLKETNINDLLNEIIGLLNNDLIKHNIKAEKHLSSLPLLKVDPSQMKQVFLNLFLNAIDSMPSGGILTISTSHKSPVTSHNQNNTSHKPLVTSHDQFVSIAIRDTGTGIPKDDLKHIFDPFFTKKSGGTGLGLTVVHGIIEKHHGKITVKSTVGVGTEFVVRLGKE